MCNQSFLLLLIYKIIDKEIIKSHIDIDGYLSTKDKYPEIPNKIKDM